MSEVLATGGENDLVGPDTPPLARQGHIHQLLLALSNGPQTFNIFIRELGDKNFFIFFFKSRMGGDSSILVSHLEPAQGLDHVVLVVGPFQAELITAHLFPAKQTKG